MQSLRWNRQGLGVPDMNFLVVFLSDSGMCAVEFGTERELLAGIVSERRAPAQEDQEIEAWAQQAQLGDRCFFGLGLVVKVNTEPIFECSSLSSPSLLN